MGLIYGRYLQFGFLKWPSRFCAWVSSFLMPPNLSFVQRVQRSSRNMWNHETFHAIYADWIHIQAGIYRLSHSDVLYIPFNTPKSHMFPICLTVNLMLLMVKSIVFVVQSIFFVLKSPFPLLVLGDLSSILPRQRRIMGALAHHVCIPSKSDLWGGQQRTQSQFCQFCFWFQGIYHSHKPLGCP